jgi:uncharacterized protein YbjT (DUF2867 family)
MATVALVGATGSLGHVVLPALVASDVIKKVVCLSRKARKSDNPKAEYVQVDYIKQETLEKALSGCDVLINTMGTEGNYEESKHALVDAAAKVGVKFYIPRYSVSLKNTNEVNLAWTSMLKATRLIMLAGMARRKTILRPERKD